MAVVGIVLRSHLLRGRGGCRRAVLCCGWGCCVVTVGVVTPCCVVVVMGVSHNVMSQSRLLRCMVVSWSRSLHRMWCCGHCTMCGVTGIAPHVVSWVSWASHCVVSQASHRIWYCSHGCYAMWCCGCGGCRCATWDRGDWTAKEEISRKKRKEKKENTPEGKLA